VHLAAASFCQRRAIRSTADAESKVERTETTNTVASDRSAGVVRRRSLWDEEFALMGRNPEGVNAGVCAMSAVEESWMCDVQNNSCR
jgi:hypothetical protein